MRYARHRLADDWSLSSAQRIFARQWGPWHVVRLVNPERRDAGVMVAYCGDRFEGMGKRPGRHGQAEWAWLALASCAACLEAIKVEATQQVPLEAVAGG